MSPAEVQRLARMAADAQDAMRGATAGEAYGLPGHGSDGGALPGPDDPRRSDRHLHLVRNEARRRANRRHLFATAFIGLVAAVSMGLVALHVLIAENQFSLDRLQQQAASQQANYEKLRLDVAQLESPSRIVSVAEGKLGMQQPGSINYLPATTDLPSGGIGQGAGKSAQSGTSTGGGTSAPQGDADWPNIKPYLSGSP